MLIATERRHPAGRNAGVPPARSPRRLEAGGTAAETAALRSQQGAFS
ncbi:MAG TPA: hypothetical protein VHL59_17490 [Thermoanaerobaculia bacterium]|nr:hypothetical protein [Thermoanaerobaculia bacterium]